MSPTTARAAGALVWRRIAGRIEVLLVHRPRHADWSWPKGKREPGETLADCAVREVGEETGTDIVLGQVLPAVSYRLADGRWKVNHYWAATVAEPSNAALAARPAVVPAATHEVDEARWVAASEAMAMLSHPGDREPLDTLLNYEEKQRLDSSAMLIVRHARAHRRSAWHGGEATRPLTPTGMAQARGLRPLLSAYGVVEVGSSPWQRCAATIAPYAETTGLSVTLYEELTEDAHASRPDRVRDLIRTQLAQHSAGVAVCTHRLVLPTIMAEIGEHTTPQVINEVPTSDPWLDTSELLVVHASSRPAEAELVVALERHRAAAHDDITDRLG